MPWKWLICTVVLTLHPDLQKASPDHELCSPEDGGGWKFRQSCYILVTEQQTWNEAEDHCRKNYNGHLVTVLNSNVDRFLNSIVSHLTRGIWIGIKIRNQFQQKWTSGWNVSYDAGLFEHKDTFNEEMCVLRIERKVWKQAECSERQAFVCETSKKNSPVLKSVDIGLKCPKVFREWRDLGGEFCYFFQTTSKVDWFEANFECQKRGGHLVSIHSQMESDILKPFVKAYQLHSLFIGLKRSQRVRKQFEWTDGSKLDYTNWESAQPDDFMRAEECVEIRNSGRPNMTWNDVPCTAEKGFICSVKKVRLEINHATDSPLKSTSDINHKNEGSLKDLLDRLSLGDIIAIAVSFAVVIVLLGIAICFFRQWTKERSRRWKEQLSRSSIPPPPLPTSSRPLFYSRENIAEENHYHLEDPWEINSAELGKQSVTIRDI